MILFVEESCSLEMPSVSGESFLPQVWDFTSVNVRGWTTRSLAMVSHTEWLLVWKLELKMWNGIFDKWIFQFMLYSGAKSNEDFLNSYWVSTDL